MRSKEFLPEGGPPKTHGTFVDLDAELNNPSPGVWVQRQLRNTDPYMQYRYGLALAAARATEAGHVDFKQESAWAENIGIVTYTAEDEKTIKLADKIMGVSGDQIASQNSKEAPGANTASPVANWMKKK
jgi:hypothetical protein